MKLELVVACLLVQHSYREMGERGSPKTLAGIHSSGQRDRSKQGRDEGVIRHGTFVPIFIHMKRNIHIICTHTHLINNNSIIINNNKTVRQ